MNSKNKYWLLAGAIALFTAFLHTIGGQLTLVDPLLDSNLIQQEKAEWLGAWHMVTIFLFLTAFYLLKIGWQKIASENSDGIWLIGWSYLLMAIPSVFSSLWLDVFAPQWVLLFPIGALVLIGQQRANKT